MPKERYISLIKDIKLFCKTNDISTIMEDQKIRNLLENAPDQPRKFRKKIGLE